MDPVTGAAVALVGLLFNAFAIPWLQKKRKLDGAELLLKVASGAMALVLAKNGNLRGLILIDEVVKEMQRQFPKTNEDALRRAAADIVVSKALL